MRYYEISITDPATGAPVALASNGGKAVTPTFSSLNADGSFNPNALNVELNCPVTTFGAPAGGSGGVGCFVQIWGVSIQDISQTQDLNNKAITIKAGMSKGLPLATQQAPESGIIVQGYIYQAYGNWQGTAQTLTFDIRAGTGTVTNPKNISFNWLAGTSLQSALAATLGTAFPTYKQIFSISPNLIRPNTEPGVYPYLPLFASYLKDMTRGILNPNGDVTGYQGVEIVVRQNQILIMDASTQGTPKQINFNDMIGQATWIGPQQMQINVVMRGDLTIGDYIALPKGLLVTTTSGSASQFRQQSTFKNIWLVNQMMHVGNFRDPNGESWITSIDAFQAPQDIGAPIPLASA